MIDTAETRNLPWQLMQKHLAEATDAAGSYATQRRQTQPHWRYMPASGLWFNRIRKGLSDTTPRR